jgi:hypothetical protein
MPCRLLPGNPDTRGWVPEVFWTPLQYLRVGAQYFNFKRYHGAAANYDGAGRNPSGNNTLFVYLSTCSFCFLSVIWHRLLCGHAMD